LTDFGNSRLLDSDKLGELGITALGFTLPDVSGGDSSGGTPLYLAPEVIAGQTPTMQSDVYALGVLLYQLMVGDLRRVMAPGWERDIDDELLCEDVALATDGDPPRRLGSVTELSERLRRLPQRRQQLARTVQAERQVEAAQRALERARARRPWVVAAASALLLGLAVSLWFAQQTQSARVIAESQAARAEAVSGFLQDLIMSADRGTPAVGYDLTVREALTRSSALLDARFANAPLTEALVRMAVAEVYGSLGEFDAAAGHLRRSVALLSAGNGPQSPQTLEARYRLGAALVGASDYEAARSILTAADTDAAALPAAETGAALARARAWSRFHLMQAEAADAVPYLERAQRLQLAHAPEDFPALHDLRIDLAQAYSHLGRFDDAVALMETLDSSARVETLSPSKRAWTRFLHGAALLYSARLEEAEPMLLEAVAELSSVWGADSLQTAQAQGALGNLYFSAGRFREALPHVDAARQTLCSLNGRDHQACLQQTGNLGIARLHAGDSAGAVAQLAAARAGFEQRWGITSPGTQVFGYYLATAQVESGDAIAAAAIAADLDPALLAAGSPGTHWETRVQALQGAILLATGRRDEGISLLQPAVAAMEADQTQEWIIGPFRQQLEGAASTQRSTGL
jgi:non-specific serine/threonine protein kinase